MQRVLAAVHPSRALAPTRGSHQEEPVLLEAVGASCSSGEEAR